MSQCGVMANYISQSIVSSRAKLLVLIARDTHDPCPRLCPDRPSLHRVLRLPPGAGIGLGLRAVQGPQSPDLSRLAGSVLCRNDLRDHRRVSRWPAGASSDDRPLRTLGLAPPMRVLESVVMWDTKRERRIVRMLSRLTTHVFVIPSTSPRRTSESVPRTVLVISATVTRLRPLRCASQLRTNTGCGSPCGTSARQTSALWWTQGNGLNSTALINATNDAGQTSTLRIEETERR
jgi:hypothetical protein